MITLFIICSLLLFLNVYLLWRKKINTKSFHLKIEEITKKYDSDQEAHASHVKKLIGDSNREILAAQEETVAVAREATVQLQSAENRIEEMKTEIENLNEQIQEMYKYIDSHVETIDNLSTAYDDLKTYSFEVYSRAVELDLFLFGKLRGGFLQDNEEVRELVNQLKTFLRDAQDIQDRYGNLFLVEEEPEPEEKDEDVNIEDEIDGFFELDDDEEMFDEKEKIVKEDDLFLESKFKVKRNYSSDKYE